MGKAGLCCAALLCCAAFVYSARPVKANWVFGVDCLIRPDYQPLGGSIGHIGYDVYIPKIPYFSLEAKVGAGFFAGSRKEIFTERTLLEYKISALTCALAPKLRLPLNFDDNMFLFLENEFALSSLAASIHDWEGAPARGRRDRRFHYALKLGLLFNVDKSRQRLAIWAGGSTLDFDPILNKRRPAAREPYSGESPDLVFGLAVHL